VDVDTTALDSARDQLQRPGVELAPRKQWPSGMQRLGLDVTGRIHDGPSVGRTIGRLTDLGWGARLRHVLAGPDSPAPEDVLRAAVAVLAGWGWQTRPVAVMGVDSVNHPILIGSVVDRLAELGRLTNLGVLQYAPTRRPVTAANSAYRVAGLSDSWTPPTLAGLSGPILLVDDVADSGWTMTMAARVLRGAGADEVLPFALASVS
jgi:ATP-dependent DNA helicase RecQ